MFEAAYFYPQHIRKTSKALGLKTEASTRFERGMDRRPDFAIIRSLFRFGLPTGVQGIAMNVAGVLLSRLRVRERQQHGVDRALLGGAAELFERHRPPRSKVGSADLCALYLGSTRGQPASRRRCSTSA